MSASSPLRWTPEQLLRYQKKHGFAATPMTTAPEVAPQFNGILRRSKLPNKTEAEFGRILEARRLKGEFTSVQFEGVRLRVGDGAWYTPDYFCETLMGRPAIFEVKGAHKWEDALVKFKAAKERHAWADFEMHQKARGEWKRIG